MEKIKTLYLIGNGFDLFHNLKSGFLDYKVCLQENREEVYYAIIELFDNCNITNLGDKYEEKLWGDFESNLAKINIIAHTLEIVGMHYPNFGDEFRDRDYYSAEYEVELKFTKLISEIKSSIGDWINTLELPSKDNLVELEYDNSFFINFNYTTTLEDFYRIPRDKIVHIHGSLYSDEYILGHGQSYAQIKRANIFNKFLYDECSVDLIYEMVRDLIVSQIASLNKNTSGLISEFLCNLEWLNDISKIIVFGLSISKVDLPYIDFLMKTAIHADWEISWFTKKDKNRITRRIADRYGKGRIIKLFEFKDKALKNPQLRFKF